LLKELSFGRVRPPTWPADVEYARSRTQQSVAQPSSPRLDNYGIIIIILSLLGRIETKGDAMKKKAGETVRHEVDLAALPPLTRKQRADLDALAALPDDEIDHSDTPSATFGAQAQRGRFYKPVKQQITTRVDADILDWLKSQGVGYQARMNAILRREMLNALKNKRRA
jgi:uncharacterized protein (DUF4415 family)